MNSKSQYLKYLIGNDECEIVTKSKTALQNQFDGFFQKPE